MAYAIVSTVRPNARENSEESDPNLRESSSDDRASTSPKYQPQSADELGYDAFVE